jgi:hypothetical protein
MLWVRTATPAEVIQASRTPDSTRTLLLDRPIAEVYEFDLRDIERVSVMVHRTERGLDGKLTDLNGPLADLFPDWQRWLEWDDPGARADAENYHGLLRTLKERGRFDTPPIVQDESVRIHDGRHRLFAMYEVFGERADGFTTQVYWVHNWPDGVLRHLA